MTRSRQASLSVGSDAERNAWARPWTACRFVSIACGIIGAFVLLRLHAGTVLLALQIPGHHHSNGSNSTSRLSTEALLGLLNCSKGMCLLQSSPLAGFVVTLLILLSIVLSLGGLLLLFWSLPSAGGDMHNMLVRPDVCFSVYFRHAWYPKVLGTC